MSKKLKFQIISIVAVTIVAALGSVFVQVGMEWFASLAKPSQWIPDFVIPIVWSIIYILAILSLWTLIRDAKMTTFMTVLFCVNGALNVLWCLLFFTLNLTFVGLIAIILNLIAGWILYGDISKTNNIFAKILIIYPIWLSIATSLNLATWILN